MNTCKNAYLNLQDQEDCTQKVLSLSWVKFLGLNCIVLDCTTTFLPL